MSFSADLKRYRQKYQKRTRDVFHRVVDLLYESVVNGSGLTGAPGQPRDTGALALSWTVVYESPTRAVISSNSEYAIVIEDNPRGVTFQNHGPHSVKLSRAAFAAIVEEATRDVLGAAT